MKRILIASRGNPDHLASLFREELPTHEVLTAVPDRGAAAVPYIVVGRPTPGLIASVPGVEVVLSLNAGIEHLLSSGEVPVGLPIVRLVDDGLADGMADWVLAHALSWHRNLGLYRDLQATGEWAPQQEKLARERIVTVLGAGALGGPITEHFVRFGFNTRVWSRSGRGVAGAESFAAGELLDAVRNADILVNLLPSTAATADVINARVIGAMAKGGFVINGGRGAAIVDADLIAAFEDGQLSGAALDVFRTEPLPPGHPFWRHPKIMISPHVAAPTHAHTAVKEMAENIRRHERGEALRHVVDRSLGY